MDSLEDVSPFISSLDAAIDNLNESLEPVLLQGLKDLIAKCQLPNEKVRIYHSYLYTVISILFAYIKVLGIKTEGHPIMKELTRIRASMKELKDYETSAEEKTESNKKSAEAANEFLQRTLGTVGGQAVRENQKTPAISSANFQGTHTRFTDSEQTNTTKKPTRKKQETNKPRVSKPSRARK